MTNLVEITQENLNNLNNVMKDKEMNLNKAKTKIMMVTKDAEVMVINLEGAKLKQANAFQYLGVIIY